MQGTNNNQITIFMRATNGQKPKRTTSPNGNLL